MCVKPVSQGELVIQVWPPYRLQVSCPTIGHAPYKLQIL